MTFSVYGPKNSLTELLVSEFAKIAKTALATTEVELQAQNAANIIVVSPFHDKLSHYTGKKILHIVLTDGIRAFDSTGTYYLFGEVDPSEAVQQIVKRFVGFESNKSCVICPIGTTLETKLPLLEVSLAKKEVVVPTKIAAPIQAKPIAHITPQVSKRRVRIHKPNFKLPHPKASFKLRRAALFLIILGVWLLSLPFALLLVSGGCAYGALRSLPNRQSLLTTPLLTCSRVSAQASISLTRISPIRTSARLSSFLYDASLIATEADSIYKRVPRITIESLSSITPDLYKLSRDIASLSSHSTELSQVSSFSKQVPFFLQHASLFQVLAATSAQAEDLLGKSSPKTYLVLLQNNMELRPTGGFIGSFLLVDVDNGEVTAQKIYDVYDADGQLSGYVKPPEAIVNYLGEASWHLRDSNWDPDFEISAKRAIWFLDKSLNRRVDGVIGVNLEVLRTLIQTLGPIQVPDYGGTLNSDNFYATIQSEVHKEFFPGSRKKSNYLTAVFNAVLAKLNESGSARSLPLLTGFIKNLDARDIQFYSNNDLLQTEFTKAGIAGAVTVNSLGFVEANVGVNKSNQYIERAGSWRFEKTKEGDTQVVGALQLTNTAAELSDETRYRVYLRTFAPQGSTLSSLKVKVSGVDQAVVPEKEVLPSREQDGLFFELKAGEKALVTVSWVCPPSTDISLWKQGGVLPYPISVSVLTGGTSRQYNTTFGQDQHIQL